ncbi:pH-response regulator protein palI/prr-5 [Fusarium oligoseptatum]|uniref:pH-response regulator protein palI/prr-5 n=1 Tax=Fusarium oligoseptatum TaxID=2604345 RepID=A0A428TMF7_9HYPO|nr:pH-response regulator protein palI/prr-5 [Fusarium oligoseptatum]
MLRPATPLSILLFAAFALLLLAVLSTPVIEVIPLSDFGGIKYGVFGYCESGKGCSNIGIGYDTEKLVGDDTQAFDLPSGVRNTLSAILVVHPVAALITLILFIMAAVSHLHSPSHSTRFLLILFIFLFLDFLICLFGVLD